VDLWSDKLADPGELIASAIRHKLSQQEGVITQLARKSGLEKISIGGLQLNLDKVGIGSGVTLSMALEALSQDSKKLIVMVIDEAQHAQTTEKGSAALYALKAARDELNSSRYHGFRLVATGSNIDKLSILVHGKEQAFLNGKLINLPYLDDDYLKWKIQQFQGDAIPDLETLKKAFAACTYRPEVIDDVLDDMELMPNLDDENVNAILEELITKKIEKIPLIF